jgi:hypothetical protein
MPGRKNVNGDDLLYRFFQDALSRYPEIFMRLPQLLITATSVWLPLDVYRRWPVLLPWVVRDASCRGSRSAGRPDAWSSPNDLGYLRDDNSLIKSIPRALAISGPKGSHVHQARMGTEFVAAHVWRVVDHTGLANRHPLLNSFVPNLVWLPAQVAKLSDREGGVFQGTLQAMAFRVYHGAPVEPRLLQIAESAWRMIPPPGTALDDFGLDDLNWFRATESFFRVRLARLRSVIAALEAVEKGMPLPERVVTRRYAAGLPHVPTSARSELLSFLGLFDGS